MTQEKKRFFLIEFSLLLSPNTKIYEADYAHNQSSDSTKINAHMPSSAWADKVNLPWFWFFLTKNQIQSFLGRSRAKRKYWECSTRLSANLSATQRYLGPCFSVDQIARLANVPLRLRVVVFSTKFLSADVVQVTEFDTKSGWLSNVFGHF